MEQKADGLCYLKNLYQIKPSNSLQQLRMPLRNGYPPKVIALGEALFFDPNLSSHGKLSCGTCHSTTKALSDGKRRSLDRKNKPLDKNAPGLWNLAYRKSFFWEDQAHTLEESIRRPLYESRELAQDPNNLVDHLISKGYGPSLQDSFGGNEVKEPHIVYALTSFIVSLTSLNSKYDRYIFGDKEAFNATEKKGEQLFRSFLTRCSECHTAPLFTNETLAHTGVEEDGIYKQMLIPSLRNVAATPPYGHAGQFDSLDEILDFYNKGGGRRFGGKRSYLTHWHVRPIGLDQREIGQLKAFLLTLTDTSVLENSTIAIDPKKDEKANL